MRQGWGIGERIQGGAGVWAAFTRVLVINSAIPAANRSDVRSLQSDDVRRSMSFFEDK